MIQKAAVGVGVVSAGAGALVAAVFLLRAPGERLGEENLEAARRRWEASSIRDYAIEVEVSGIQQGVHRIRVEGGRVIEMTTGGAPVPPGAWNYWSVEGMFGFLAEELEHLERPREIFGVESASQVVLRVSFDEELGIPRRFLRQVLGGGPFVRWEIREFQRAAPVSGP